MRRTRQDPPTILELEIDAARQARLQANVERLAIEYKEEKERLRIEEGQFRGQVAQEQLEEGVQIRGEPAVVEGVEEQMGDEVLAQRSRKQAEEEREAARRRREEFGECRFFALPRPSSLRASHGLN